MATERTAEVSWRGSLFEGRGTIERVQSGAFGPLDVTWVSRSEEPDGLTSPEELIAATIHVLAFRRSRSVSIRLTSSRAAARSRSRIISGIG